MLLETLIPNAPKLHFGQRVLHGDDHRLDYDLVDIYTPTPKIKEDIEFQRGLIIKLKPEIFPESGNRVDYFYWDP
jgi:hypothetical protein